jgi:hypothetical protein
LQEAPPWNSPNAAFIQQRERIFEGLSLAGLR